MTCIMISCTVTRLQTRLFDYETENIIYRELSLLELDSLESVLVNLFKYAFIYNKRFNTVTYYFVLV